ncbi:peptidoglycan-binding protein [Streptomyces sp. NBC_01618]|uniref:peptidoglycan-binding protein n=1 Tax=Streptomyces sp. NBC_01618 TaxID=2975900 RepID=UPI00386B9CEF|nr:peptidoglycan-binding protein [Streptomyces sp. NBC_01618]
MDVVEYAGKQPAAGVGVAAGGADRQGVGRRRRGPLIVGAGILLVAAISVVGTLGLGGGAGAGQAGGRGTGGQAVEVTRDTLTDRTEIDGRLGHGPEVPFQIKASGTVTWLPESGRIVRRGETVLRVDDRPVVLLYGSLPMYRGLGMTESGGAATGGGDRGDSDADSGTGKSGGAGDSGGSATSTSTRQSSQGAGGAGAVGAGRAAGAQQPPEPLHGMDVKQFETNLSALGYSGFTVDDSYSSLTAAAVKRWQKDLGLSQTGRVGAGDVVYAPGPVRIASTGVQVGANAVGNPLSYTSTSRMVDVDAPASDTNWARRGRGVTVELPDGRSVKGKVARVGKDASGSGGSGTDGTDGGGGGGGESKTRTATVSVVITFDDQSSLGRLESGPVTVRHVVAQRKDILTVPVAALVALAEGGHGLELAENNGGGGTGHFVPVITGLFADGRVEVNGPQVHEGMKVKIPK